MNQLIPMLVAELPRVGRCLEIGIGTGRMALPLVRAGIDIVGVDISPAMLRKLVENARGEAPPLVVADATRLPFAAGSFECAIAAHVFHLIAGWTTAVTELERVLIPGGVLLAARGDNARAEWQRRVRQRFFEEAAVPRWPPGMDRLEELDALMAERGATVRRVPEIISHETATIDSVVATLESGTWSALWTVAPADLERAAAATRRWAGREIGELDEPRDMDYASAWRAYILAK